MNCATMLAAIEWLIADIRKRMNEAYADAENIPTWFKDPLRPDLGTKWGHALMIFGHQMMILKILAKYWSECGNGGMLYAPMWGDIADVVLFTDPLSRLSRECSRIRSQRSAAWRSGGLD